MTNKTEGIIMYHKPPGSYRPVMNCVAWLVIHSTLCQLTGEWLHQSHPVSRVVGMNDCVAAVNQCNVGNFCTSRGVVGCFWSVIEYFKVPLWYNCSELMFVKWTYIFKNVSD